MYPHHAKIFRCYDIKPEKRHVFTWRNFVVFDIERALAHPSSKRKSVHKCCPTRAGKSLNPIEQVVIEHHAPRCIAAKRFIRCDACGQDALGTKPRIHMRYCPEASDHQAGGCHQQHRKGHLGDGKRASQTLGHGDGCAAAARLQCFGESRTCRVKRRSESENQARQDGERTRKHQNAPIYVCLVQTRRVRGQYRLKQDQSHFSKS